MTQRGNFPAWINIWVLIGSIFLSFSLLCLAVGFFLATSQNEPSAQSTAILDVIHAATATNTATSQVTQPGQAEDSQLPTPPPGAVAVNSYVQVIGTGGDGLRLRIEPSLDAQILMLGSESEVFRVHDGPREADGYTWWYLVGPFDSSRYGWAVANFLMPVQGP